MRLQGDNVTIGVNLNGRRLILWSGPQKHLDSFRRTNTGAPVLHLPEETRGTFVIKSLKFRMLSGEALPLPDRSAQSAPANRPSKPGVKPSSKSGR